MIARNLTISRDKTDNDITDSVLKEAMEMTNLSAFVVYPTNWIGRFRYQAVVAKCCFTNMLGRLLLCCRRLCSISLGWHLFYYSIFLFYYSIFL
jgi:hypothetical protein